MMPYGSLTRHVPSYCNALHGKYKDVKADRLTTSSHVDRVCRSRRRPSHDTKMTMRDVHLQ